MKVPLLLLSLLAVAAADSSGPQSREAKRNERRALYRSVMGSELEYSDHRNLKGPPVMVTMRKEDIDEIQGPQPESRTGKPFKVGKGYKMKQPLSFEADPETNNLVASVEVTGGPIERSPFVSRKLLSHRGRNSTR